MATDDDEVALAMFQLQVEREREDNFLRALTDENRAYVLRVTTLRDHFLHCIQVMMTETVASLRMEASSWVSRNAVAVAEGNATVMKMRVRYFELHP